MIDLDKIPKDDYLQLVELMGKEDAEAFIEKKQYNYYDISLKILFLRLKKNIKKKPRLFLLIFLIILALVILYYLDLFLII
ncbi:MAG: hypothetical protein EH224_10100 [Calditrichaeota bacterium]|nr:MAG: hypothetical protein EH224_10100 [Calditrichota bacterium]